MVEISDSGEAIIQRRAVDDAAVDVSRTILQQQLAAIQKSADKKGGWEDAATLHELAGVEATVPDFESASKHEALAVQLMHENIASHKKVSPEAARQIVADLAGRDLVDSKLLDRFAHGTASKEDMDKVLNAELLVALHDNAAILGNPRASDADPRALIQDRREAIDSLKEAAVIAEKLGVPAIREAELLRSEAFYEVMLGTDLLNGGDQAGYRNETQKAEDILKKAIENLGTDESNNKVVADKAMDFGDLGFTELHRANTASDDDAIGAKKHLEEAIRLWEKYDPTKATAENGQTATDAIKAAQVSKDTAYSGALAAYMKLLEATGQKTNDHDGAYETSARKLTEAFRRLQDKQQ